MSKSEFPFLELKAWDRKRKKFVTSKDVLFKHIPVAATEDGFRLEESKFGLVPFSGMRDKNKRKIFFGDILTVPLESGEIINVVCRYDNVQRIMDTGWEVEIPSFYFERPDGLQSFPIVDNWAGQHDLRMMEIIGNIFQNPELLKGHK